MTSALALGTSGIRRMALEEFESRRELAIWHHHHQKQKRAIPLTLSASAGLWVLNAAPSAKPTVMCCDPAEAS